MKEDVSKSIFFLNDLMLASFYDQEFEDYYMILFLLIFLDAVLKPNNIIPDFIFDIEYNYENYSRKINRNILSYINIPYGLSNDYSYIHLGQLSYLDCLYDNI